MTGVESGAAFAAYWRGFRRRTRRLLPLVPEERIEWSPGPGRWSFGDLFRHLGALERWMYAENVSGRPSRYPGHGPELAEGSAAIGTLLDRCHEESLAIFGALTPADMVGKSVTPAGSEITTAKWLRAMVEHEAHHRGQIYLMLGLLGVETPQLFGLTEEEVRRRSAS
ncbi:MAG: DinB family protein [Gemmatimonadales bacterium]